MRSQNAISKVSRGGRRYLPRAFTEQGVAMLSSVLRSERGIENQALENPADYVGWPGAPRVTRTDADRKSATGGGVSITFSCPVSRRRVISSI